MSSSKIIHRMKNFTTDFLSEHHFVPYIVNVTCRFRTQDTLSFLKYIVKYSYLGGARGVI